MTINRVLALVTPSSATNSGSVRDAFDLVTRNWVLALVTRSSVTKSERFWSESWTGPDFWSLSTQRIHEVGTHGGPQTAFSTKKSEVLEYLKIGKKRFGK